MKDQKTLGVDSQLTDLASNGNRSSAYSNEAMKLAAVAISLIREVFPMQQAESDEAAKLRLDLMAELAEEVGEQRFVRAVRDTIKVSHRRWDCSIARVREMAGLRWQPPPSATAKAWEFVTQVFIDHCRTDANGNYVLEDKIVNMGGIARVFHVPEIPSAVKRAIQGLGGWAAIAEAWPEYHGQRYKQFQEFFYEDQCGDARRITDGDTKPQPPQAGRAG